jgi:PAS domain S-box-containing protein
MEEDVRKSEKKFRDLFTSAPVGIYQSSPDGDFLSANTMLATMLGYDAVNELLQQNLYDIYYYPHERDALIAEYARRGSIANVEILWKKKDGAPIWIELTAHAIKNENGRVTSFEGYVKDIAQRKQSGKRLLESEQKYSTLIETMREGLCYTNNDGLIQFVNARFCELLGYTPSELYGTHYFGLLFSDEDQRRAEAMRQAMQQNFLATQVFQLKKKNGDAIWIRANASVVFDEEGSLIGSVGIVDDISEQKNIEQTLQRRDAILEAVNVAAELFLTSECWEYEIRTVLQKLGEATEVSRIYLFETTSSPSGEIYASQRFEWVQTGEPQIDNPDLQMFPLRERGFQRWIDTLGNGETIYGHLKHFPPSEKEVLETQSIRSIVIVPIVVEKKWWGFMGYDECRCEREWSLVEIEALKTAANIIGAVITRTKMEEAKTRSEEQYRALFQEMQEVVFVATPQGQLLEVNPAGYKLFHFPFDKDLSSVNVIDAYVNPAQREALLKELTENGSVKDFEVHLNTGEGNEIDALLSATANRDKNGTLVTYRGMLRDITEKKILEEQILRAQQLESIGTLAGGIAHDFNNILGIILGYASLLETDKEHPERFSRDARAINSAVERGAGLVTQLLTFARKADAHLELLNVNRIVEDLHRFLSETLTKNISLQMQLGKKIPSIVADAKQLHQSLFNVCINARDAMPGGGTITLETSVVSGKEMQRRFREAQARDYVRIIVRDTGIGMDEKTKNRIFEPFFTTKDIGKGRGLGLSVAYGIIQNHNGFIDVESKLGNGTSFLLYFPMQWGIVETESETDDALPEGTETLLVVEDEALLRDFVKTILESVGYTVYEARNGEEAVEMYAQKKNEIQLVITDMGLPRLSGEAEFYQLKEINANVKVILASSYLEPSMKSELLKQGAKAFIQKPYEVHQLLQHVRNVLDVK